MRPVSHVAQLRVVDLGLPFPEPREQFPGTTWKEEEERLSCRLCRIRPLVSSLGRQKVDWDDRSMNAPLLEARGIRPCPDLRPYLDFFLKSVFVGTDTGIPDLLDTN